MNPLIEQGCAMVKCILCLSMTMMDTRETLNPNDEIIILRGLRNIEKLEDIPYEIPDGIDVAVSLYLSDSITVMQPTGVMANITEAHIPMSRDSHQFPSLFSILYCIAHRRYLWCWKYPETRTLVL